MPTMVDVPPPSSLRVHGRHRLWASRPRLRLVYIGHRTLVLRSAGGLVPLTAPGMGLMPEGAQFRVSQEFDAARALLAALRPDIVDFGSWRRLPARSIVEADLALRETRVSPEAVALFSRAAHASSTASGQLAASVRSIRLRAQTLVRSLARNDSLDDDVDSLIGAGPGTTPSGDDVVVGVLAGLRASGRTADAGRLGRHVLPLLDRTTETSRYFLRNALSGSFAEHVHVAVSALGDPRRVPQVVRESVGWGATSGLDLLAGLAAGAAAPRDREAAA